MKRSRLETPDVNHWTHTLVGDMRDVIRLSLCKDEDYASLGSLRRTCRMEHQEQVSFFARSPKPRQELFITWCIQSNHRALLCWGLMEYPTSHATGAISSTPNPFPLFTRGLPDGYTMMPNGEQWPYWHDLAHHVALPDGEDDDI